MNTTDNTRSGVREGRCAVCGDPVRLTEPHYVLSLHLEVQRGVTVTVLDAEVLQYRHRHCQPTAGNQPREANGRAAEAPTTGQPAPRVRAKCKTRPVYRPGSARTEGAFCADCIDRCHEDTSLGHWCQIDRWADEHGELDGGR